VRTKSLNVGDPSPPIPEGWTPDRRFIEYEYAPPTEPSGLAAQEAAAAPAGDPEDIRRAFQELEASGRLPRVDPKEGD
jgi:hypothetical protein